MNDLQILEMEVRALLIEAEVAHSQNQMSLSAVKQSLMEFISALEEEFRRFPDERKESHWDLVMNDGEPAAESTFVLFVVSSANVQIAAGRGRSGEVRSTAEHYDGGADRWIESFGKTFKLATKRCDFPKALIDAWILKS